MSSPLSPYKFLKFYDDWCSGKNNSYDDLENIYTGMKSSSYGNIFVGDLFLKNSPTSSDMMVAIDSVVTNIYNKGETFLHTIFPKTEFSLFKNIIGKIYEKRSSNSTFDEMVFLEKQQIGMTTKEDIFPAIEEYERLFQAGIISDAELLTLFRFYSKGSKYDDEVVRRGLNEDGKSPLVVGGPASVVVVDKEGHLITAEALAKAFPRFMKNVRTRNAHAFHSDVQAGWILPAYISKNGMVFRSGVNKNGLWVISELRDDIRVAQRLSEEIIKGRIRSFSIAGSATNTEFVTRGSQSFMQVNDLEIVEITYCEQGVNQGSHFDILKSADNNILFEERKFKYDDIVNMIPPSISHKNMYFFDDSKIIIKSEEENELTDKLYLELRKYVLDDVDIIVTKNLSNDAQIIFKDYGEGYYSQLIMNYPDLNSKEFSDYVTECTGFPKDTFDIILRHDIEAIANDWLKDRRASRPEFTTMFVNKSEYNNVINNFRKITENGKKT